MNRKELIDKIAKASNLKKGEVKKLLSALSETISESLGKGEKVTITGFGTFVISQRKGRIGINPRNPQQKIKIPATVTAHFRASKKLKDEIR